MFNDSADEEIKNSEDGSIFSLLCTPCGSIRDHKKLDKHIRCLECGGEEEL
jgi:hypothetical protein